MGFGDNSRDTGDTPRIIRGIDGHRAERHYAKHGGEEAYEDDADELDNFGRRNAHPFTEYTYTKYGKNRG